MQQADVVIAGAGIVGLSVALRLKRTGRSVLVMERKQPGSGASMAAAGMLAAHDPANPPELRDLAERSLDLYPDYLWGLEDSGGRHVPFETEWTLERASEPDGGSDTEALPSLLDAAGRFRLHRERSLDPRKLFASLHSAAMHAGVVIASGQGVASTTREPNAVTVALDDATSMCCRDFLDCTGAWSGRHARPVKGQMLRLRMPGGALTLEGRGNIVVRTPEVYLVPRLDGTCLIGATVEDAGFDEEVRPEAKSWLLQRAAQLVPEVSTWPEVESWCGLRPGTSNALPVLGRLSEHEYVANGLYRNGILLAPAVAEAVALIIEGQEPAADLSAFAPQALAR